MDARTRELLFSVGKRVGTPCYVYRLDEIDQRLHTLRRLFGARFSLSYAVKANPNRALLEYLRSRVDSLDVSSIGEVERALAAGYPASRLSFSGPAKRESELRRALELGVGEMICESEWELERLSAMASGPVSFLLRINPTRMPAGFGVSMAGKPSPFGVDEEQAEGVLERSRRLPHLEFSGLHIYSGTNCLDAGAVAENFQILIDIFLTLGAGRAPRKLVFGSGFGIPYHPGDQALDVERVAALVNPQLDAMELGAERVLELGRWVVGPAGYFLASVVNEKHSRGAEIRMLDAGFNHHLAAWGMLGAVIRRAWCIDKVSPGDGSEQPYVLVGPLCTTIDRIVEKVTLPELRRGDIVAVSSSGAYGLSASPTGFISHPKPREILLWGEDLIDATE